MMAVLHFLADADDPVGVVRRYHDKTVPGSYFAISHTSAEGSNPEQMTADVAEFNRQVTGETLVLRTRPQIAEFVAGLELVDPGLVHLAQWRPDSPAEAEDPKLLCSHLGAVGTRP